MTWAGLVVFDMLVLAGLLVSVLLLVTVWAAKYSTSKRHQWELAKKIPGPRGWPILGNALSFTGSASEFFAIILGWTATHGPTFRFWMGPQLYVVLTNPADLQIVLGTPQIRNRDFIIANVMGMFFGTGLLSSRDETWRLHRKLITPAFHFKILESYVEIFGKKAEILSDKIRDLADGRTTDISHQLSLCGLDSICETALGTNMNIQSTGCSEFADAINKSLDLVYNRLTNLLQLHDRLYPFTSDGRKAKTVSQTLHQFSEGVIASKLASYENGDLPKLSVTTGGDKKISSFLDLVIDASRSEGQSLTAEEIRDEVTTLAAGGMETITTTMAHILVLLGMHPEYQDKIDEELASIFQDDTRTATSEDVQRMQSINYAIFETLRLLPSVTLFPREITQDLEISNGYILPAGCSALGFTYPTHRNAAYYPDPERFWPERWAPENSVGRHPYAFLPFSAGSRNCIGQKYAMLFMKATLSSLLRRYRFTCDCYTMKDLEQLDVSITLKSAVGYRLQIHKKKLVSASLLKIKLNSLKKSYK